MSRRRRAAIASQRDDLPPQDRLRPLWLAMFTALCVATPILPSETVLFGGSIFVLMLLWWMLLAAWSLAGAARGSLELRLGPTTWAFLALLAWHSASALAMAWYGNPRASLNMLWQWTSFGIAFFLARQLITIAAEQRAVVAVMVALAVSLSTVGYYQYYRELPAQRALYEKDPEKVLSIAGVHAPPGTPQRKQFEDRLNSTEPIATYALTNSLAGFLAPWLTVALGILLVNWHKEESTDVISKRSSVRQPWTVAIQKDSTRIVGVLAPLLIAGCLVLTKSRTAWVATIVGLALLLVYGRRVGWRPDWRIVAGLGAAMVVLPFLAAVVGGLDWLVILESSKSFLYRVQYWRGSAELIADYPWFGCGPGNFQQFYTAYKLPEASETIAEPHNFLLEVWATAGTPALVFFLAIFAGAAWQVWRAERAAAPQKQPPKTDKPPAKPAPDLGSVRSVYWGSLVGGVSAYLLCGAMEGYLPSPGLIGLGFPLAMATVVLLHRWVCDGSLSCAVLATAIVVMLVNFLGAGGIGFAGVAQSLWLLLAVLVNHAEATSGEPPPSRWNLTVGSGTAIPLTVAVGLLLVCFYLTAMFPVTQAETLLLEGTTVYRLGQVMPALAKFRQATDTDPWSPEPWERLSDSTNEIWLSTGESTFEEPFSTAVRQNVRRNARSSHAHQQVGSQWLRAYRRFGQREYLELAIRYFGIAVKLYPNYNLGHAQFAWAMHLAGNDAAAELEASEALRLDSLNPHHEQKLSKRTVEDVEPTAANQPAAAGTRDAEQLMNELRKL